MDNCGDIKSGEQDRNYVRLIGHSIGSRVVPSSLYSLYNDSASKESIKNFTVTSSVI
jgi:hypothetical protein